MKIVDLARLRSLHLGLTLAQRYQLKIIMEGRSAGLISSVCDSLVDCGLVRRYGNTFIATEDGLYVALLH